MAILICENLGYGKQEHRILEHVNLTIEQGDCMSVVGASGSGKSTLLRLLASLISPNDGQLFFKGINYQQYDPIALRKMVSYCMQIPLLFGQTVADNLGYPAHIRGEQLNRVAANELLLQMGLMADYLDQEVHHLSGGEKQRIALIRHLMYPPDILLLDEITSALDDTNTQIIEHKIQQLNEQGTTIVWVTHDLKQSQRLFNKRVTLDKGQVVGQEVLSR